MLVPQPHISPASRPPHRRILALAWPGTQKKLMVASSRRRESAFWMDSTSFLFDLAFHFPSVTLLIVDEEVNQLRTGRSREQKAKALQDGLQLRHMLVASPMAQEW